MNYYNTTTEPSYPEKTCPLHFWNLLLTSLWVFSFTAVTTEGLLQWIKHRGFGGKKGEGESESESESEGEEETYTNKYTKEYENLKEGELEETDFLNLTRCYVREETPGGEVIMSYDKETGCFLYYTNNLKEITYAILETVARKFVVENNCKTIYTVFKPAEATDDETEDTASVSSDEVEDEVKPPLQPPSVFAKFKKYNTGGKGSVPNFKAVIDVVEQTNHFRFKGKLYDYEDLRKRNETERNETETTKTLDYAAYKKQLLEKGKKDD